MGERIGVDMKGAAREKLKERGLCAGFPGATVDIGGERKRKVPYPMIAGWVLSAEGHGKSVPGSSAGCPSRNTGSERS